MSRRAFLGATAATGLGVAFAGGLGVLFGGNGGGGGGRQAGYGALVKDPRGVLDLPEGFSYRLLAEEGVSRLESGERSPSDPDGVAAFPAADGTGTVLICNHEVTDDEPHPVPHVNGLVYDSAAGGGTTNIELDEEGRVVRHYVSLAGTRTNYAGGRTL